MSGYVCQLQNAPEVTWASTSDQTDPVLLIKCDRVDHLTIQSGASIFAKWFKIAQLIEESIL